ncbi:hypothetical protein [Chengkuizengella marina]|nr:hypothetical protein [Chengkuizengella marina]
MKWEEVEEIGVVNYGPYPVSTTATFLCISKERGRAGRLILNLSKDCIYIKYRKSLIPLLRKYWRGEIQT